MVKLSKRRKSLKRSNKKNKKIGGRGGAIEIVGRDIDEAGMILEQIDNIDIRMKSIVSSLIHDICRIYSENPLLNNGLISTDDVILLRDIIKPKIILQIKRIYRLMMVFEEEISDKIRYNTTPFINNLNNDIIIADEYVGYLNAICQFRVR